jgi:hypothetical protein
MFARVSLQTFVRGRDGLPLRYQLTCYDHLLRILYNRYLLARSFFPVPEAAYEDLRVFVGPLGYLLCLPAAPYWAELPLTAGQLANQPANRPDKPHFDVEQIVNISLNWSNAPHRSVSSRRDR